MIGSAETGPPYGGPTLPFRKILLVLYLAELTEGTADNEHPSQEWLKAIDRGGLVHVANMTHMLFVAMELTLHQHLNSTKASALPEMTARKKVPHQNNMQLLELQVLVIVGMLRNLFVDIIN